MRWQWRSETGKSMDINVEKQHSNTPMWLWFGMNLNSIFMWKLENEEQDKQRKKTVEHRK